MSVRPEEISQAIVGEGEKGMPFSKLSGVTLGDGISGFDGSRLIGEVSRLLSKGEVSIDFGEQGMTLFKK